MSMVEWNYLATRKKSLSDQSKQENVEDQKKYGQPIQVVLIIMKMFLQKDYVHLALETVETYCLSKSETKVKEIFDLANTTRKSQIKGSGQLEYLTKSVDILTKKIDDFQEELKRNKNML